MRSRSACHRCLVAFVLGAALLLLFGAARAHACGVSSVDGSWSCGWDDYEEAVRPRWQAGAAALHTRTRLRFGEKLRATQLRNAVVATLSYAPTASLSVHANAGAALGGELRAPNGRHEFSVGPSVAAGLVYTLRSGRPFVALSAVIAATFAHTRLRDSDADSVAYSALDLRAGIVAGTTLFELLSPYVVARLFGGPVFWRYAGESVTGTDVYHFQLGAGVSVRPIEALVLFIEAIPLGERALSGGAAFAF